MILDLCKNTKKEDGSMRINGTMLNYYFVCKRKLWHFVNSITFEHENDDVLIGKLLDKDSYDREKKHILIDESINIDFLRDWKVLHEIKKSKSIEESAVWQVKYYLWFLRERGVELEKGVLDYPKLKKREDIFLEEGDGEKIKNILEEMENICSSEQVPQVINSKICRKCAYYEFCYI